MAKKIVSKILGGKKHPRFKLIERISTLAYQLEDALTGYSKSPARADKRQAALDEVIAEYIKLPAMQNVAHVKKIAADVAAKAAATRAARRAKEKLRKERERVAQKKRNAAARAKAKREKLKVAKAAKKAAAQAKKDAKKAPKLSLNASYAPGYDPAAQVH